MNAIVTTILTVLASGVFVNWLVYRWQLRNWVNQQKMLRVSNDLQELRKLADTIRSMSDARNYRARKICRSYGVATADEIAELKKQHDTAVTHWNDNWNYFCVGLTLYADFVHFSQRLEKNIQMRFVKVGSRLKYLVKETDPDQIKFYKSDIEVTLNEISGETFNFTRDLQNLIRKQEQVAYSDPKDKITRENLHEMSLLSLFKGLFKPY